MQEWYPGRFVNDRAFAFQLVRKVRLLDSVAVREYYDCKSGKQKKVYRDMKPKTMEFLATVLTQAFGTAGVVVAKLEAEERLQQTCEQKEFYNELANLR